MLVGSRMSKPVITVRPEMSIQDAMDMMRKENVSRFPVIDNKGNMVGIVSETDLIHASPSEATTLSIWEIHSLLSKITVDHVMSKKVITVTEETPLEEAARLMADKKIGGLPVMRGDDLVGIITETDLFKIFLELLGARESGVRLSALMRNLPGELCKLTSAISAAGGNIVALATFLGDSTENRMVVIKVIGIPLEELRRIISPLVELITDLRETKAA